VYKADESIIDFKQTNKMKKREWIEDYFIQLAAYAKAHNKVHGTSIRQGVIMMVSQEGQTQEFLTCGREFDSYGDKWMRRVEAFERLSTASSSSC
jgi:genome maintenance exonuclease 1